LPDDEKIITRTIAKSAAPEFRALNNALRKLSENEAFFLNQPRITRMNTNKN